MSHQLTSQLDPDILGRALKGILDDTRPLLALCKIEDVPTYDLHVHWYCRQYGVPGTASSRFAFRQRPHAPHRGCDRGDDG